MTARKTTAKKTTAQKTKLAPKVKKATAFITELSLELRGEVADTYFGSRSSTIDITLYREEPEDEWFISSNQLDIDCETVKSLEARADLIRTLSIISKQLFGPEVTITIPIEEAIQPSSDVEVLF